MRNITLLVLMMVSVQLYAQEKATGKILDADGNPIAFASVYFPQLEKNDYTDENGMFTIDNVPNGSYKIIVSILGYESKSSIINIPQDVPLELILKTSAIEMDEVIVSTPFHKLQNENVMKVERETVKELERQGALNIAEGITSIAGVESVTTGASVGKPVIRGLSSNRVLVYTQGVRLENQQFGDEHGLGLNGSGIESVEVIKGPSSLLYGSDALGGVLYLNPERFAAENETDGSVELNYFTNTNGINTSAGIKTSGESFKYLLRASATSHTDYETNRYSVTNTRFKETDVKAGIGYQRNKFKTELRYNFFKSELGLPEEIGEQTNERDPQLPFQDIDNHILSSKSNIFFNKGSLDVTLGYIYNDRKEFEEHHHDEEEEGDLIDLDEGEDEEGPALHMKLNTLNYDVKYNLPVMGKFETIVGVQGMNQRNENFGEEELIPDATTNDIGILGTSHIHFEKIDIQIGARFDHRSINVKEGIERDFNSFNSAVGFKTDLTETVNIRLNVASGFRAPNLAELTSDGTHEGTNRYEIGNPNLDNEQNLQIDLAVQYRNEHIDLFGNLFVNYVDDFIFIEPNGEFIDDDPVFLYEQDKARLYGGEFGIHLHPHPLDWLHVESSFETVTGQLENDDYLPLIPANSLNNTLRVEFNTENLEDSYAFIKLKSVFDQNNVSEFETTTESYNLLSAGLGTTIPMKENQLELRVTATNILNTEYINHLSRLKQDGILNMGRNIGFGVNYVF